MRQVTMAQAERLVGFALFPESLKIWPGFDRNIPGHLLDVRLYRSSSWAAIVFGAIAGISCIVARINDKPKVIWA